MKPCIQIHIPRTAGTSITQALKLTKRYNRRRDFKKSNWSDSSFSIGHIYLPSIPPFCSCPGPYFKFAFARNPFSRMVSLYNLYDKRRFPTFLDFCKYIQSLYKRETVTPVGFYNRRDFNQVNRQVDWILDKEGKVLVDFIGNYEYLEEDFLKLCRLLDLPGVKLPHAHKKSLTTTFFIEYYKRYPECIPIVLEIYEKDFKFFGYPMEFNS